MIRNPDGSYDENEWTADERARFEALSANCAPPPELKRRTVRALRERRLLGQRTPSTGLVVGGLVAAAAVFAAGAMAGYSAAERRPASAPVVPVSLAANHATLAIDSTSKAAPATRHVVWY
jgi:hypothetical protein